MILHRNMRLVKHYISDKRCGSHMIKRMGYHFDFLSLYGAPITEIKEICSFFGKYVLKEGESIKPWQGKQPRDTGIIFQCPEPPPQENTNECK